MKDWCFTSIRFFVYFIFICAYIYIFFILGGQSDQGYGSKDELHQDSTDACKAAAFPLSDDDLANKSKTVKSQQNGNASFTSVVNHSNRFFYLFIFFLPFEIIVIHNLFFAPSFAWTV